MENRCAGPDINVKRRDFNPNCSEKSFQAARQRNWKNPDAIARQMIGRLTPKYCVRHDISHTARLHPGRDRDISPGFPAGCNRLLPPMISRLRMTASTDLPVRACNNPWYRSVPCGWGRSACTPKGRRGSSTRQDVFPPASSSCAQVTCTASFKITARIPGRMASGVTRSTHLPVRLEIQFQADEFKQSHRAVEFHQHVNVAGGSGPRHVPASQTRPAISPRVGVDRPDGVLAILKQFSVPSSRSTFSS